MNEQNVNKSLYNIADEFQQLDDMLDATGGEITTEYEQHVAMLEQLLTNKVDGCCGYIQRLDDLVESAKNRKRELDEFIERITNKRENFEHYVKLCMTKTGRESFVGELFEIKTRKPTPVLEIVDESKVPLEFTETVTSVKIDKMGLKKAIASGRMNIDGVRLVDGKQSVTFKLRSESKKRKEKTDDTTATEQSIANH